MSDQMQRAREMLAAHLTLGSATHTSVLKGPPYPYGNVTIGQALKAICDALSLADAEQERCEWLAGRLGHCDASVASANAEPEASAATVIREHASDDNG